MTPDWPVLEEMLPTMHGRRVVALGASDFARWATAQGASSVLVVEDLANLSLPEWSFDVIFSSRARIEDARRLFATIARALAPGGRLVFSVEAERKISTTINQVIEAGLIVLRVEEVDRPNEPMLLLLSAER